MHCTALSPVPSKLVLAPFYVIFTGHLFLVWKDGNSVTLIIEEGVVGPLVICGHSVQSSFCLSVCTVL